MAEIPHAVLSEYFQELMKGRRLHSAVFLTYQYDPGFFEQEILPVFFDISLSHASVIRLVQLEDAIRTLPGQVAVYYDANGIVISDAGSAKLDTLRIPVQHHTGIFHPKNILLLVDDEHVDEQDAHPQSLIIASMSANLTRSGWWENIEACYVEEVKKGDKTRIKDDLTKFLKLLLRKVSAENEHLALSHIIRFLKESTAQHVRKSKKGQLHTHFYAGGRSIADFLEQTAEKHLMNAYLEIISPYFDNDSHCKPLDTLIKRFKPREVRLYVPRSPTGEAACRKELFESVSNIPRVKWGRLPKEMLRLGKSEDAGERFVHAKIYRFFNQNPKREIYFIGSANLTSPAHQNGGNVETGLLIDRIPPRRPDFWLLLDESIPGEFQVPAEDDEPAVPSGSRLRIRYLWDQRRALAFWDAKGKSPTLTILARGVEIGTLPELPSREWTDLTSDIVQQISEMLNETSLFEVHGESENIRLLLVQEEGMSHKPSLLLQLSIADILRYWSLLTTDQRASFIETIAPDTAFKGLGGDLVTRIIRKHHELTIFDRFAGYFHAFGCLERAVKKALKEKTEKEATYRLFGKKYDSLGTLLERIDSDSEVEDSVDKYVIIMCAKQLCREVKNIDHGYWNSHGDDVAELNDRFKKLDNIRECLLRENPHDFRDFLDWFDNWFIQRAKPV